MEKLVFATSNPHKAEEIRSIFDKLLPGKYEIITMREAGFTGEIEETGETFEENAFIKAKAVYDATGLSAIADDSGLAVDALDGRPGVYSARYGGESLGYPEKMAMLQAELREKPGMPRTARFVSVFCGVFADGRIVSARGECEGEIAYAPAGSGTFGYDPVFYYPPLGKTFAEMTGDEKNAVSHRGNAVKKFVSELMG